MPIIEQAKWDECVEKNQAPYGKACVDVARCCMEILDEDPSPVGDCHDLICRAEEKAGEDGLTGFKAGAIASMISWAHSRGDEFRRAWNHETQIGDEGDKANEEGGVLNPELLNIGTREHGS